MQYLKKKKSLSSTQKKIDKCKKKAPKIIWHIQNYHYETRVEHYKDSEGNSKTRRKRVRVNTFYKEKNFKFKKWVDLTPPEESLDYLDMFNLVRLEQPLKIKMNDKVEKKYKKKKSKFWKKYKIDRHADFWEKRTLKHLNEMSLVYNDKVGKQLWYANEKWYNCLTCCMFGWIQRIYLVKNSQRIKFKHKKKLLKT